MKNLQELKTINVITHFVGSEETANEIADEYNELLNTNSFKAEKTDDENVFRISGLVSEYDLTNTNIKDEFIVITNNN